VSLVPRSRREYLAEVSTMRGEALDWPYTACRVIGFRNQAWVEHIWNVVDHVERAFKDSPASASRTAPSPTLPARGRE
jgi:hypothetical protein